MCRAMRNSVSGWALGWLVLAASAVSGGLPAARGQDYAWGPLGSGMNGHVYALTVYNGELIAGGGFSTAGGVTCSDIARWNGSGWHALGSGMIGGVYAVTVYNGELIAGGWFTTAGGVVCNRIARWNGSVWQPLGSGMGGEWPGVCALTVYNGELIAGGWFTTAGGVTCNHIARWNGSVWQPLGSGVSDDKVSALTVYDAELIAGGEFYAYCPGCYNIARWNGSGWQSLASGLYVSYGSDNPVMGLVVYNGELIAGGDLTNDGHAAYNRIARWNGSVWQPLGSGVDGDVHADYSPVMALAVFNGMLIAGGSLTTAGGVTCNYIARWNGSVWQPLGSGMSGDNYMPFVCALTVYNDELIAGGGFTTAGGMTCNRIARWAYGPPNHPPVVSNVTASQRTDGSKLVDIRYNLADGDGDSCTVTVQASSDGGATWTVPITAVSGAVGGGITPRVNRLIVWNCATDLPGAFGNQYKVRVCADDGEDARYADSGAFTIDNRGGGTVTVWASVSYDEQTKLLSIAALAFDALTGVYVTTGAATYNLAPLPYSGNLTYTGTLWVAQVDLSLNPPAAGQHAVVVTIQQGTASTSFNVGTAMGMITGQVRNVGGGPIVGAEVSLYDSLNFHGSGPLHVLGSRTTGSAGTYAFNNVAAGSYVVFAEASGYLSLDRPAIVDNGETLVINFVLPSELSLAWLMTAMQSLHDRTVQAMNAETLLMPEITEQAADDLNYGVDDLAWDVAQAFGDVLSETWENLGQGGLRWVVENASPETIDAAATALINEAALKVCVSEGIEKARVLVGTRFLLPQCVNGFRRYEYNELVQLPEGPYGEGASVLQASNDEFQQTAMLIEADPAFDFAAAWRAIAAQEQVIGRLANGQMTAFLLFPDPADGLTGVSLPIGRETWLMNHVVLNVLGGTSHALTVIQCFAGGYAVASAVTVVGLPAAAVAGEVAVAAGKVNEIVGYAGLFMRGLATFTYGMVAKSWSQDMLALPAPYLKTCSFLEAEAAQPTYLAAGRNYSAAVSVDLHADLWNWIFVSGPLSFAWKTADVHITNTGNTTSTFRVVGTGWWDYHLPSGWPWDGLFGGVTLVKVPVSLMALAGSTSATLGPGQAAIAHVPYMGVYVDPFNMFSPHWLQVDVYSGPFLVATRSEPFYVVKIGLKRDGSDDGGPSGGFNSTFLSGRTTEFVDERNSEDFLPVITTLADTDLSPDDAVLEVPFTVDAEAWSASFQLAAQQTAGVSLRVYDSGGHCVGYDVSRGGVQTEFPGTYSGAGSPLQVVEIPAAAGNTYTVKAILESVDSAEPVHVQLWALETPARPAVMSVVPAEFSRTAYTSEEFSVPVLVGESGGQVPLESVTIIVGTITGPDETPLVLTSWAEYSFESIPARRSNRVEFGLAVPQDAPSGTYAGTVTVASTNAGSLTVPVTVTVYVRGDWDGDGHVDADDWLAWSTCMSGPWGAEDFVLPSADCLQVLDSDADADVDIADFAEFQVAFSQGPALPLICQDPNTLTNSCQEGQNAPDQTFQVWNCGLGTLSYTITTDAPWVSCDPNSGTSTAEHDTITVHYATTALTYGQYTATITITDPNATNNPQTIHVTLNVQTGGVVFISAGEFQMGDPWQEGNSDQRPVHTVYLSPYYLDAYEVTNQQYADALTWAYAQGGLITVTVGGVVHKCGDPNSPYCDTATSSSLSRITWNGSTFGVVSGKGNHPMVMVSWYGSLAYCNWRSAMESRPLCYDLSTWTCNFGVAGYRLPTEAEWEKAAGWGLDPNSGQMRHYRFGEHSDGCGYNCLDGNRVNYSGSFDPYEGASVPCTTPVGFYNGVLHYKADFGWPGSDTSYQTQNAQSYYGCYDMSGNAWEWCYDWYSGVYYQDAPPWTNPTGTPTGTNRVLRGGSWNSYAYNCRSATRYSYGPNARDGHIGFRCAVGTP